jgi:hypothetical protein
MMNKHDAAKMKESALKAIEELTGLLDVALESCSEDEYQQIRKGVGLSIGRIQTELLDVIYAIHPELDHLK